MGGGVIRDFAFSVLSRLSTPTPLRFGFFPSGSYVRCLDHFTMPSLRYTPGTFIVRTTGALPRTTVLVPSPSHSPRDPNRASQAHGPFEDSAVRRPNHERGTSIANVLVPHVVMT